MRGAATSLGPEEVPGSGLTSPQIDAVKGVFIALIVAGHNTALHRVLPSSPAVIYNFHIFAFFLLPFLLPSRPLSRVFLRDRAVRYGVPHLCFFGLASVLYALLLHPGPLRRWLADLVFALVMESPDAIHAACGLRVYWFLPALFSLAVLRSLGARLGSAGRAALLAVTVAFHLLAGWLPDDIGDSLPYGIGIALFVFPLGPAAVIAWNLRRRLGRTLLTLASASTAFALGWAAWSTGHKVRLASLNVYGLDQPLWLALHAALPVAAFVAACGLAPALERVPGVVSLGRHSLVIFLVHQLVYQGLLRVAAAAGTGMALAGSTALFAAASIALTVVLSAAASVVVSRTPPLSAWILPRTAGEWPPLARAGLRRA